MNLVGQESFRADEVLSGLKDFKRETAEYAFRRLYLDPEPTSRFLVAGESGLGKTLVARGLITKSVDHLWDSVDRMGVLHICSNQELGGVLAEVQACCQPSQNGLQLPH